MKSLEKSETAHTSGATYKLRVKSKNTPKWKRRNIKRKSGKRPNKQCAHFSFFSSFFLESTSFNKTIEMKWKHTESQTHTYVLPMSYIYFNFCFVLLWLIVTLNQECIKSDKSKAKRSTRMRAQNSHEKARKHIIIIQIVCSTPQCTGEVFVIVIVCTRVLARTHSQRCV